MEQLRKREGEFIRKMGTLNQRIECRTVKEWVQDNIEKRKEYHKEYDKEYYKANKEIKKEYDK